MRLLALLVLFSIQGILAQNYKFGKVTKEELIDNSYEKDTTANAVVLYKEQNINFIYRENDGFVQRNEVHERIKIYNKEGFEWATKRIRLYDRYTSKSEKLLGLNGYTYTLKNGKVVKTKLKKEGVFEEKTSKYLATKSFTMPNVSEGCIIEFEYKIESPYAYIDDVVLQYNIPIAKLEVSIKTPEYFNYKKQANIKAVYFPKIEESRNQKNVAVSNKQREGTVFRTRSYELSHSSWVYDENTITIKENNIPALKTEPFVNNLDNYRSKLILEYSFFKGADGVIKDYTTTWESVAETIYKSDVFGGQLKKIGYFKEEINALIEGINNPKEKISVIYNFLKSKMRWNGLVGFESNSGVKKAYKARTGNVGDINLMLTAMLTYAGVKANPVLISTRANGIPVTPTLTGFNYVVTAVEVEGKTLLLDATNTITAPGTLPLRAVNWQGRMIKPNGKSTWINLSPKVFSRENVLLEAEITDNLSITGTVRKRLTNYLAYNYRSKNVDIEKEEVVRNLEESKGEIKITDLDIKNLKILNKPINYSYNYTLANEVEQIGNKLYLSPLLFFTANENVFKQDKRAFPIDFIYPAATRYSVNLKIPEGYTIESLPENIKIQYNGNEGDFSFITKVDNGAIQITLTKHLKTTYIIPEKYQEFKTFTDNIVEKESQKIVLKKE